MMRSAAPAPPSCVTTALATIVSGIIAVSAPDASAIARSNPATFWKRLTTRRTKSGRSQKVSVCRTRSRFTATPEAGVPATAFGGCSAWRQSRSTPWTAAAPMTGPGRSASDGG